MKKIFLLLLLCFKIYASVDLEELFKSDLVISNQQIHIPEFPNAFNPSIVKWNDSILLSFRTSDPVFPLHSWVGLATLDDHFNVVGKVVLLDFRQDAPNVPSRTEDARLIVMNGRLFVCYNDNVNKVYQLGKRRIYLAELENKEGVFAVRKKRGFEKFEGVREGKKEKNWVPFVYENKFYFGYSILPHIVLHEEKNECKIFSKTRSEIDWKWGRLRGGTPALLLNQDEYLAFFHSSRGMDTIHAPRPMRTYVMGAYTFESKPPFAVKKISHKPIVGPGFYSGEQRNPFWGPARVIFPGGYFFDDQNIYIAYGKADSQVWLTILDKKKLCDSLTDVPQIPFEKKGR